jgi:hypothetical protein
MKTLLCRFILPIFLFLITFISCTKMQVDPKAASLEPALLSVAQTNGLYDPPFTPHDDDSIERITVLGAQSPNPYLVPNMQQAYKNLGYNPNMATVTNLYVRFKPTTAQLAALDSIMDAQGFDLFDTPMDYDVTYEGDYYQDPSIPNSLPTWQYAVVLPNFVFPAGIIHETLAQIHIPTDAYTAIETEAENIAGGGGGALNTTVLTNGNVHPNTPQCPPGYHYDFSTHTCTTCPSGYTWDGTACVPPSPPPTCSAGYYYNGSTCVPYNTTPPAAAPDAAIPAGGIRVYDTQLSPSNTFPDGLGVRKLRMVARRWFKVERTYTDGSGNFTFTKHFKHKVRIIEKFKNDDAKIFGIRGVFLWQMLYPIKRTIGIFSGDKSNIAFINMQTGPVNSKGNRYWAGATTHNAVQEHKDYATLYGFSKAPTTMNIFLTNWSITHGLASTPLFHIRFIQDLPSSFINTFLVNTAVYVVAGGVAAIAATIARTKVDMAVDYNPSSILNFTSDHLKETVYHEMSHASHYSKVGTNWYTQFVNAEIAEIVAHPSGSLNPYGDGTSPSNSPIIALGEGWAYHMGHFLADQRYDVHGSCQSEQSGGISYCFPDFAQPHIAVLENFDPNFTPDSFRWIPKGLMEDLIDNTQNETSPVIDNVNGFTIAQLFNALQSDVTSVQIYRARFIQQNLNNQTTNITNLFAQYHY